MIFLAASIKHFFVPISDCKEPIFIVNQLLFGQMVLLWIRAETTGEQKESYNGNESSK